MNKRPDDDAWETGERARLSIEGERIPTQDKAADEWTNERTTRGLGVTATKQT